MMPISTEASLNTDHHIKAIVRIRPLNALELSTKHWSRSVLHVEPSSSQQSQQCLSVKNPSFDDSDNHSKCSVDSSSLKKYVFDTVHGPESTQLQVFDSIMYIVDCVTMGFNGTIFAYGQTGTGKTHTLFGTQRGNRNHVGVTQLSLRHLFHTMNAQKDMKTTYTASFIEIYHDKVYDLLASSNDSKALTVREGKDYGVYVQGNKQVRVESSEDAEKILHLGLNNRHINETKANRVSSRSHAIYTVKVETTQYVNNLKVLTQAKLTIVDLAGSERQKSTDVQGIILKEASSINKSLLFLGKLIDSLALKHSKKGNNQDRLISYRDCKLTFLLRDSLGGNAKTCLIATVSPSASSISETISTLTFLQKAKLIENNANINIKPVETVDDLKEEITKLRKQVAQLQALNTDVEETAEELIFSPSNKKLQDEVTRLRLQVKQLKALDTDLLATNLEDQALVSPSKATPKASGSGNSSKTFQSDESLPSVRSEEPQKLSSTIPVVILDDINQLFTKQMELNQISTTEASKILINNRLFLNESQHPQSDTNSRDRIESRDPLDEMNNRGIQFDQRDFDEDLTQSSDGSCNDHQHSILSSIFRRDDFAQSCKTIHEESLPTASSTIFFDTTPPRIPALPPADRSLHHEHMRVIDESNKNDKDKLLTIIKHHQLELQSQTLILLDSMDKLKKADIAIAELKNELSHAKEEANETITQMKTKLVNETQTFSDKQARLKRRISDLELEVNNYEKAATEANQKVIAAEECISRLQNEVKNLRETNMRELEAVSSNVNYLQSTVNAQKFELANAFEKVLLLEHEKETYHALLVDAEEKFRKQSILDQQHAKEAIICLEDIIANKISELKGVTLSQRHSSRSRFNKLIADLENDLDEFHSNNYKLLGNDPSDEWLLRRSFPRRRDDVVVRSSRPYIGCGCFDFNY